MPLTDNKNYPSSFCLININKIDPSSFQPRKYFDENSLRQLGASIAADGLIEPIILRPQKKGRFELIAGERRLRAVREYTDMDDIQAKIIKADDLQARRISDSENILRQDLSAIESIEATIKIIDVEMGKEPGYLTVGKTPLERVHKLLSKLHSTKVSKDRGSIVSQEAEALFNNFVKQVKSAFNNLPKPLKWQSFLLHDLVLLTDIPSKVQKASVKHSLNKAQTKALAQLEQVSDKVFHDVTRKNYIPFKGVNKSLSPEPALNECSAREIQVFAENLEKTNQNKEQKKDESQQEMNTEIKIALMMRLGIHLVRIAQRLNIHRETISKYAQKNNALEKKILQDSKEGFSTPDIARKYFIPQTLVWSVVFQNKT